MFRQNRHNRMTDPNFTKDEGYQKRFGSYGMRGSARHLDNEPSNYTYGQPGDRAPGDRRPQNHYSDYSAFEGATDRPYYGGEEGRFPFGGAPMETSERNSESYNADERKPAATWFRGGTHTGKGPKGYRRSDERIREEVCELLTENAEIDASEIEVQVKDSEVILSGFVESRHIKRLAEDVAESVTGVLDVRNELRVAPVTDRSSSGHFGSPHSPQSATMTTEKGASNSARGTSASQRRMNS